MLPEKIMTLINDGNTAEAIKLLSRYVSEQVDDDFAYYVMGRLYWQQGNHAEAVNSYRRAIAINPDSKARHALEMATDVFDFFNPDLLNP